MVNNAVPFSNSYWVIPGKFLAGEYPGASSLEDTHKSLQRLIESGVTYCLDLTEIADTRLPYYSILQELANQLNKDIQYRRIAIRDFSVPTLDVMTAALDALDQALELGRVVYIHCLGGIGRTGTVVGCFLVRHGMEGALALEYLTGLRKDTADWWYPSPEAPEQAEMIRTWKKGA